MGRQARVLRRERPARLSEQESAPARLHQLGQSALQIGLNVFDILKPH